MVITETCRGHYIWHCYSLQDLWGYYCKMSSECDHLHGLIIYLFKKYQKRGAKRSNFE